MDIDIILRSLIQSGEKIGSCAFASCFHLRFFWKIYRTFFPKYARFINRLTRSDEGISGILILLRFVFPTACMAGKLLSRNVRRDSGAGEARSTARGFVKFRRVSAVRACSRG